ncbi:MAG: DUF3999 family protein [Burkholderiaceae bacterium]
MKIAALAGLAALALACTQAAPAAAADAALPLTLNGAGPYYTLAVNLQARQLSTSSSLADLRVRNAAGEAMAFAWVDAPLPPPLAPQRTPARIYKVPLPPAAASATDGLPRQAWIVDAKDASNDLLRLDLGLEHDTQGVYTLSIESSDDLQHWRMLQEDAQLVQLQALPQVGAAGTLATLAEREHLSSNGIDLDNVPARYLRLTTAPRSAIPPLVSATLTRAPHRPAPAPLEWSAAITASGCEATSCDYPLPRNSPIATLQIAPADVDTIGQVMVMGQMDAALVPPPRHSLLHGPLHALRLKAERAPTQAGMAWDSAALASVYWLTQASGAPDLHSPPVRLGDAQWRTLRLETFGPITQLGHSAPTIRIGVRLRQLVFVARGAGPFTLARATSAEQTTAMALSALMPGHTADTVLPEGTATLVVAAASATAASAPSTRAAAPAEPAPSRTPWLWAALLAGLALMGRMAWSLLRKPAAPAAGEGG